MRVALIILCVSAALATAVASPRVDVEESALLDREVIATRDPDRWQGRQVISPIAEEADDNTLTDGHRTIEDTGCYQVRVRGRREDGALTLSRWDWCD